MLSVISWTNMTSTQFKPLVKQERSSRFCLSPSLIQPWFH